MSRILIAGKDWQARALLRAQLLEEGFDVEAYETIPEVVNLLTRIAQIPALLIADISASDDPTADLETLAAWSHRVPIWILASRTYTADKGLGGHGFEKCLLRPVEIGKVVREIKQRLGAPKG